ncbi:caspase family protein [Calothrix sp. FACHB-156]|nr:caspase family protein [Calothrix sp. FACHB-156]
MSRDALVVGINKYPFLKDSTGNYKHLRTPASDAEAIAQLLETHGNFRVKRFPSSIIDGRLQVDPNPNKLFKTEELEQAILDLFLPETEKPPETALLFFAGHGFRKQLRRITQGFLAASDSCPSKNQWGFSLRDLWEILQQSEVKQQIIWLDCCFAGELLNFNDTELGGKSLKCDRSLIAASRDYEVACQQLDEKHGVLTGALLAGLNPHLVLEDNWITNRTLAVSVEQNLQKYYDLVKIPQSPLISNHREAIKLIRGKAKPASESTNNSQNTKHTLIFDLLLQVDFKQQTNIVREVMKSYFTAGFLVHNEPECGLEFLLAKLFRMKPSLKNNKPIVIDVGYRNIERLWTQLGRYFHVYPISTSDILEKICDRWQTQDVVFIFNKVDCLQPEVLSAWLDEFWQPLVNIGKENSPQKSTHLFMFLVDHGGKVHQSNINISTTSPFLDPRIPLYLPPVNSFPQEIIEEWITEVVMQRSDIEIEFDKFTSEILFQKSCQGIPQFVFEEICSFFSIDCEKVFAQCTKI